ncbi:hypothetical protein J4Q44_G00029020 [Coregonus suidteri]|uniref:Pre-B-cell leukemia homeobox interacting protein 1a n=1 Tax=Coregonus suidteri TaxID=861788 RepID=A0AAN8MKE5_9TELE
MSDNSSSTGSSRSGSLTTSWTMLSPEEAAESVGPVDDGTESLCDVPSLSEEVAGATVESKPSDPETPIETVLSEVGQQVCQEMAPDTCEGPVPSSPTLLSPSLTSHVPLDPDLEIQPEPPIIHSMVTSSPTDNEQLAAMPFVSHVDLVVPLDASFTEPPPSEVEPELSPVPESSTLDTHTDTGPVPGSIALETSAPSAKPDISIHTETPTPTGPPSVTDIDPAPELLAAPESPAPDSPPPDTIGSEEAPEEPALETEETELPEKVTYIPKEKDSPSSFDFGRADTSAEEGDGLRRRNVAPKMTSDEEDEVEVEFKLAERTGEKKGFSMNTCIVGALILLCLGSLFLSDDSDELSGAEQNQDWLDDPQKMKELLDKLTQENLQISQLETQLQAHKEELDSALNARSATGNENGKGDLEQENTMKEELSSLPGLKEELESLRARVTELSRLTAANQDTPPLPSSPTPPPTGQPGISNQSSTTTGPERRSDPREGARVKEELQRQKVLLEESRKRLEGMKKNGNKKDEGYQKRVRESLAEIQRRLSEQVEKMGKRSEGKKKPWESGNKKDGKKGKDNSKDHWKKEEKKAWKGEKDWKHGKDKEGRWKEKDERKERDWKANKENSHKEAWGKSQDEWEREKNERRMDRDKRKQERPWQSRKDYKKKTDHHHEQDSNHQEQHQPHLYEHTSFWKHQEEKLGRNVRPLAGCSSVEDCASQEGLFPVELSEFEELLDGYLSKLERATSDSKAEIQKLAAMFFRDGVFVHDKVLFSDFAEDVADILEDMVDILEVDGRDDEALEETMEEFEREALWKFTATT